MAAPQDVHVRICNQEIVKFDLEVKALIQDIRDCSGPLSTLTELNTKVKEKFQQLRHRIQPVQYQRAFIWTGSTFFFFPNKTPSLSLTHTRTKLTYSLTDFSSTQPDFSSPATPYFSSKDLEQSAKEQDKESEKQLLLQEVENHKKQLLSNQTSWRKANLTCKIAIDNLEKAELLQGGDLLRQRKTTKESLAQTSSAITESLMGISRMMAQQVQQSEEAMQSLVTSSRTILDANEEFKSMSGTIQLGRKLITKYNRRELTDKLLIFLALALFLATVLYIVKKRLFPFL
uniref:BCL2 interacting protein 1 n=1 Tax=Aotus nancymaae TaxID=37293 RepID=A0A2K5ECD6_AOTNA